MKPESTPESVVRERPPNPQEIHDRREDPDRTGRDAGEISIAEVCRKEGLNPNTYYRWSKEFLEAGRKQLQGETLRQATSSEVTELRKENEQLIITQHSLT